ncbi:hypothetical protein BOTBODRAFT_470491 [Botryobasidium botryosum FD-172 SS1]|uniref:MYND-type domain-containing protein n=1 Tax=Botryobasidium botryosum (strain FD-172 SS1) TaxID=930990 RepID=A0A067M8J9_BOTB1|nr:hypothetical protein BOTBODRAFT_470491 [Botryobasidium botryosum FD-172 SS1]
MALSQHTMDSPPTFKITAHLLGSNNYRVEVDYVVPIIPPSLAGNSAKLMEYAQEQVKSILIDLKSCYAMNCEFYKPARANIFSMAGYLHLPPKGETWRGHPSPGPFLMAYIHALCSSKNECSKQALAASSQLEQVYLKGEMPKDQEDVAPTVPLDDSEQNEVDPSALFPRHGSCAHCKTFEKGSLSKCAACKVTGYCGALCQKADWPRHKRMCKLVENARAVHIDNGTTINWK